MSLYEVIEEPSDSEYHEVNLEDHYYEDDEDEYEDLKKKNKKKNKKKKEKSMHPYKIEFVTQEPQDRITYAFDFKNEISKFSRSKFNSHEEMYKPDNPFKSDNLGFTISSVLLTLSLVYIF